MTVQSSIFLIWDKVIENKNKTTMTMQMKDHFIVCFDTRKKKRKACMT